MKNKFAWQGLLALATFIISNPQAFSQESQTIIDLSRNSDVLRMAEATGGDLVVLDVQPPFPNAPQILAVGELPGMPGCQLPLGGRPPQYVPPGGPPMHGFMMPMLPISALDLTDDQISRLAKLHRDFRASSGVAFVTLHSLESEMQEQLSTDNTSDSDVKKLAEEIAHQKADLSRKMSAHLLESSKILTAEQRRKMRLGKNRMEIGPLGGIGPMFGGGPMLPPPPPPGAAPLK